jgi:aminoglycoside phosphotransferase
MTETDLWRIELQKRAEAHLAAFLEANPEHSVDREQPECRGGTWFVTFGSFREEPAVFKYYDGHPRKDYEKKALELFGPTGLVPKLYPGETDRMLVMERLPGLTLEEAEKELNPSEQDDLYFHLGEAVAKVVEMKPGRELAHRRENTFRAAEENDFYNTPYSALDELYRQADTATFFDTTLARAAQVLRDRDVAHREVLNRSIASLQQNRDAILSYTDFVIMDDFHTNNIMAEGTRITGFIDLEMTRPGNEILLLGAALCSMCDRPERWESFRRGYERARGTPMDDAVLSLVRIAAPFTRWIRFTWYCSINDIPKWAVEMNLRHGAVEDVAETIEAVDRMTRQGGD